MKKITKLAVSQRGAVNAVAQLIPAAIGAAKEVGFHRPLANAQPDEKARYDAIYASEIAPYYTAQAVDEALISSQFLEEGEPVAKANRELFVRLGTYEGGMNFEIAAEDGSYLGFMSGLENSEVFISDEILGGKHVLIVTFPDYGDADIYGFDPAEGRYLYGGTVSIRALAA